jgi:hypothetical protein
MIKNLSLSVLLIFALAVVSPEWAIADPIPLTLTGPIVGNILGPQSQSHPCIIAGTTCPLQPAGFGYNNFTSDGNTNSFNMFSTTPTAVVADSVQGTPYTVSQFTALGLTTFVVAIDVNTTGAESETLQLFEVIDVTNNTVLYNYIGPTPIGDINNNGNGFGDWMLSTISLAGLAPNTQILFRAQWNGAVDGAESFFLVSADEVFPPNPPPSVPEPASALLLGMGISALGIIRNRWKI